MTRTASRVICYAWASHALEIYVSIVQRKVLTPNDVASLEAVADRLLRFQEHCATVAKPFEWRFTRRDLTALFKKLHTTPEVLRSAA